MTYDSTQNDIAIEAIFQPFPHFAQRENQTAQVFMTQQLFAPTAYGILKAIVCLAEVMKPASG